MRTSIDVESITDRLNPAQRDAVLHRHGPLLILAGAGSGKTRVVTHRIARLVATGCPANNILAITFTNKAAAEMRDRTEALCGFRSPWITTFHSFAARVLRRHIYRIEPYDTSFSICDTDDCKALVKEILKDRDVDSD
ncbi:MAG: UvrD-helicase domain-containing protein, partial [Planctomycetota bacterium]